MYNIDQYNCITSIQLHHMMLPCQQFLPLKHAIGHIKPDLQWTILSQPVILVSRCMHVIVLLANPSLRVPYLDDYIRQLHFQGLHSIVQRGLALLRIHIQHPGVSDRHILFTYNTQKGTQLQIWTCTSLHNLYTSLPWVWAAMSCHAIHKLTLGLSLSLGAVHKEYLTDQESISSYDNIRY